MPSPYAMILAAALLATPPGVPEIPPDAESWPELQEALQNVAIEWEILDPRQVRCIFARLEDFEENLNFVRRQHQELKNAPPLSDHLRFPSRDRANEFLSFNRAYRRHLESRQFLNQDRGSELILAARETDCLYQLWDAVRDCRGEHYYVGVRRQALKRLRDMLGQENYESAKLPPCVPIWRFEEN